MLSHATYEALAPHAALNISMELHEQGADKCQESGCAVCLAPAKHFEPTPLPRAGFTVMEQVAELCIEARVELLH
jgi:hypothetical protein